MPKALLITEKASTAKDIQNAYNKIKSKYAYELDITHTAGHLIGLCAPDEYTERWGKPWTTDVLPMIPDKWQKKVLKPNLFKKIKTMYENGNYDYVINAGDTGREGQLIQELIYEAIGITVPILRYWADDTTEKTIITALNNLVPNEEYKGLTDASYLRLYFDWLIGMNFSRAASLSLDRSVRIGRIKTATLALIVERELAIANFVPKEYYELAGYFKTSGGTVYKGFLINEGVTDGNFYAFENKEAFESLSLSGCAKIMDATEEEKTSYAPTLLNLSDLQKECSLQFGMTSAKTLEIALSLYEKHFISYPKTESKHLTSALTKDIPVLLESAKCIEPLSATIDDILANPLLVNKVLQSKKYVNDNKVSDHPALTTTNMKPDFSKLSCEEQNVYDTIARRLLAIFLPPHISITTTILTEVDSHIFKSTGTVIKNRGWKTLYKPVNEQKDDLPTVSKEEIVFLSSTKIFERKTQPPSRYNDATIITAMETAGKTLDDKELEKVLLECAGLGTPATRAKILTELEQFGYIETKRNKKRQPRKLIPTNEGTELIQSLQGHTIISPELTAQWEKKLKDVEKGICPYDMFYNAMIAFIKHETLQLFQLERLGQVAYVIGRCPVCGNDFVEGKDYYYCQNFTERTEDGIPECSFALPKKFGRSTLKRQDIIDLITKKETAEQEFTWSDGSQKTTKLILTSDLKIGFSSPKQKPIGNCPKCSGAVYAGKNGFYCENARKNGKTTESCDFSIYKLLGKTPLKAQYMKEILKHGKTKMEIKITWESGKTITGTLQLDKTDKKYRVIVVPYEEKIVCKCPYCNTGEIKEQRKRFVCTNYNKSCNFWLHKSNYGTVTSSNEAKIMLTGGDITKELLFKDNTKRIKTFTIAYDPEKEQYIYKFIR